MIGYRDQAKHRVERYPSLSIAGKVPTTPRTGAMLFEIHRRLLPNHVPLQGMQQLLALGEREPEGLHGHVFS